jgi:hypothetical protein
VSGQRICPVAAKGCEETASTEGAPEAWRRRNADDLLPAVWDASEQAEAPRVL